MSRLVCALLAVALILGPVRASAAPAGSVVDFDALSARQARHQFEEMADQAEQHGALPRLADPVAGPVLRAIWNAGLVVPGRHFTRGQGLALAGLCQAGGLTVARYVTFRARDIDDPAVAGNFLMFQAEIAEGMDFTLRCSAALLDVSSDFLRTIPPERLTDPIKTDADGVRQGVVQNLSGALRLVREGYLRAAAIARLAGTLRENAERLARNLPEGERRDLAVLARSLVAKAGPSSADLEAFARAMDAP